MKVEISEWIFEKINLIVGVIAVGFLIGWIALLLNIEIKDLDLWLHLASGRYIVETGAVPHVDMLSCSNSGASWNDHEWLFQVIVYFMHSVKGIDGFILMQQILVGITFSFLFLFGYQKDRLFFPLLMLSLIVPVFHTRFSHRPDLFSILFIILYYLVLGTKMKDKMGVFYLIIIQVLWVNIHGFFIFGPLILGVGILSEWIKRSIRLPFAWNKIGRVSDDEYRNFKLALPIVIIACFCNPYFIEGAMYPLRVLFSMSGEGQIFFDQITELQKPMNWSNFYNLNKYGALKVLIVMAASSFIFNFKKLDIGALIIWGIFLLFGLNALRNITFIAIMSYLVFLSNYQSFQMPDNVNILGLEIKGINKSKNFWAVVSVCCTGLLILWIAGNIEYYALRGYYNFETNSRKSEYGGGVALRSYAVKGADFLVENEIKGNFFNHFNSGAYLLGRTHPNIKIFMDGRTEFYGEDLFKLAINVWAGQENAFESTVEKYNLTGVFLSFIQTDIPEDFLNYLYHSSDWELVYFDYDAAVFLKNVNLNKKWIQDFKINLDTWEVEDRDFSDIRRVRMVPISNLLRGIAFYSMGFYDKAEKEANFALQLRPEDPSAYRILAKVQEFQGDHELAYVNYRKMILLAPHKKLFRVEYIQSLINIGRLEMAKKEIKKLSGTTYKKVKVQSLLAQIAFLENEEENARKILEGIHVETYAEVRDVEKIFKVIPIEKKIVWNEYLVRKIQEFDESYSMKEGDNG